MKISEEKQIKPKDIKSIIAAKLLTEFGDTASNANVKILTGAQRYTMHRDQQRGGVESETTIATAAFPRGDSEVTVEYTLSDVMNIISQQEEGAKVTPIVRQTSVPLERGGSQDAQKFEGFSVVKQPAMKKG